VDGEAVGGKGSICYALKDMLKIIKIIKGSPLLFIRL
jgi:hypothetical protein